MANLEKVISRIASRRTPGRSATVGLTPAAMKLLGRLARKYDRSMRQIVTALIEQAADDAGLR